MSEPSLHHYVPRLYLRNFTNEDGRLWVYDKQSNGSFPVSPDKIAAEHAFNRWPSVLEPQDDPLAVEIAFGKLETQAAPLLSRILNQIRASSARDVVDITATERVVLTEFISAQYFRTREMRELLIYLLAEMGHDFRQASEEEKKAAVFAFLASSGVIEDMSESIHEALWLFAKNGSSTPLVTSDHPVCIKNSESRLWLKGIGPLVDGSYIVFPLSPDIIMFCHEKTKWQSLRQFDCLVSPVVLDQEMVEHENAGQAFAATRFIFSREAEFDDLKEVIPTIGTDMYAGDAAAAAKIDVTRTASYLASRPAQGRKRT